MSTASSAIIISAERSRQRPTAALGAHAEFEEIAGELIRAGVQLRVGPLALARTARRPHQASARRALRSARPANRHRAALARQSRSIRRAAAVPPRSEAAAVRIGCSGSAAIASSSVVKWFTRRRMVAGSKRSVLYSSEPARLPPVFAERQVQIELRRVGAERIRPRLESTHRQRRLGRVLQLEEDGEERRPTEVALGSAALRRASRTAGPGARRPSRQVLRTRRSTAERQGRADRRRGWCA